MMPDPMTSLDERAKYWQRRVEKGSVAATEVHGLRDDGDQLLLIEVDGIIVAHMAYVVASKYQGLAQALLNATREWAQQRDADNVRVSSKERASDD